MKKPLGVSPKVEWGRWKLADFDMIRSRQWKDGPKEFGVRVPHWPIFYCFVKKPHKGYVSQDFYAVDTIAGKVGAVPFECTYNRAVAFWPHGFDLYYITGRYMEKKR